MTAISGANWPRRVTIGMGLLMFFGAALALGSLALVYLYQSAMYPEAKHVSSSTSASGINQIYAGSYRWSASTITFFESEDTPDKIIRWYGPRHKNKTFRLGPLTITLNANEVHYTYPILYRISTQIAVAYEIKHK